MEKIFFHKAGSRKTNGPRHIGEILREYFSSSNDHLAVAFREHSEMVKVEQSNADDNGKE